MSDFEIRATQSETQSANFIPNEPEGDEAPKKTKSTSVYLEGKSTPELQGGVLGFANEIPLVTKENGNVDLYYKFGAGNMASAEAGIKGDIKLADYKDGISLSLTGSTGVYGNLSFTQKAEINSVSEGQSTAYNEVNMENGTGLPPVLPGEPPYDVGLFYNGTAISLAQGSAKAQVHVKIPANNFGAYADGGIQVTGTTADADVSAMLGAEVALQGKYIPITVTEASIATSGVAEANGNAAIDIGETPEGAIVHGYSQTDVTAEADVSTQANAFAGIKPETKLTVSPKVKLGIQFGKGKKNGINVSASTRGFNVGYERKF